MTVEIFKAYWQKVSPHLHFPGTKAGNDATCTEWARGDFKFFGMRNAAGLKSGIVRTVSKYSIEEGTFFEDKLHGLSFVWFTYDNPAFKARIFKHGDCEAFIAWKQDGSMFCSNGNKEFILNNDGLSLFKP